MEPVTITTAAVLGFIFTKSSETLIQKATEAVLNKIKQLRDNIIKPRLQKYKKAQDEIEKFDQGSEADLKVLETYLDLEMIEDKKFAEQVQSLANEINKEFEKQGQGSNVMNVYGGKAYQQNQNQGKIYNADTITIHEKP
ncbi:hypothetical protein NIES21_58390 (plasmid) [Anabaenopsis circularis NIES-21]|uniref:Uncharacterized protein n=1 Tax=Anabaenopsis circularis NIES-21 TaxID=1085406 RepID=A0A1Z4GR51_9CYAN|nr:hypothetical protein NIES21_58390 [Anabaenopsis circularis NIES-21]